MFGIRFLVRGVEKGLGVFIGFFFIYWFLFEIQFRIDIYDFFCLVLGWEVFFILVFSNMLLLFFGFEVFCGFIDVNIYFS